MPDLNSRALGRLRLIFFLGFVFLWGTQAFADICSVCGLPYLERIYVMTDRVTEEKKPVCENCIKLQTVCSQCGMPLKKDFTELPDGRFLCLRDARNSVLDDDEARQTILETQAMLDRLFSRFISFPVTNLTTAVVDRVNLTALFSLPGRNYECPNVLGYTQSRTNNPGKPEHKISVLSGLPKGELRAVCAHELTHAWVFENVSAARMKTLGGDAHEGFCELIAYLLNDSKGDEDEKKKILRNPYTRGQIDLFVEAERRFGFNDVVDWMKYGQDSALHREDLNRIRNLQPSLRPASPAVAAGPSAPVTRPAPTYALRPVSNPTDLVLKGVSWTRNHPLCVINDRTFEVNEQGQVWLNGTNLLIRCVTIRQDGARVRMVNSGEERDLTLAGK